MFYLFLDQLNLWFQPEVGFRRGPQTLIQRCHEIIEQSPGRHYNILQRLFGAVARGFDDV